MPQIDFEPEATLKPTIDFQPEPQTASSSQDDLGGINTPPAQSSPPTPQPANAPGLFNGLFHPNPAPRPPDAPPKPISPYLTEGATSDFPGMETVTAKGFLAEASKPIVQIPAEVGRLLELSPNIRLLPKPIREAVEESAVEFANAFESPLGLAMAAAPGGLPAGIARAAYAIMALPMFKSGAEEIGKGLGEADVKATAKGLIKTALASAPAVSALAPKAEPSLLPKTDQAIEVAATVIPSERQLTGTGIKMPEFQEDTLTRRKPTIALLPLTTDQGRPMPELSESTLEPGPRPAGLLPAPGETVSRGTISGERIEPGYPTEVTTREATILLPESPLGPRTAGYRIKVEPFEERPIPEREPPTEEQISAIQQAVEIAKRLEPVPGAKPYEPPVISVDLRQLEKVMKNNTVSTMEAWADKTVREKLSGTSANPYLDPEFLAAAAVKGAVLLKRGVIGFAEWSAPLVAQFGKDITPHLRDIYDKSVVLAGESVAGTISKEQAVTSALSGEPPIIQKGESNATQGRNQSGNIRAEPQGTAEVRQANEAGARDSIQPKAQSTAQANVNEVLQPPKINPENGAASLPPPISILRPDTYPDGNPWTLTANPITKGFIDWWKEFWPRDAAVIREHPESPAITAHQKFLADQIDYMNHASEQPWFQSIQTWDELAMVDFENYAVKRYHELVEGGATHEQAMDGALEALPSNVQAYFRYREARSPLEEQAAASLDVPAPGRVKGPYLARLTNREGQEIVKMTQDGGLGSRLKKDVGTFDRSRTHLTMADGIAKGTQYDPVAKAVWLRELMSARLEATAKLLETLKGEVLFDTREEAMAASNTKTAVKVEGIAGKDYWARSKNEALFLKHNFSMGQSAPWAKLQGLASSYIRNPSLINPLPHVTKNMLFKYIMARVNNSQWKSDVAEFAASTPGDLKARFERVMPMPKKGDRLPEMTAREVGTWAEKLAEPPLNINKPSTQFIFAKADPAMRYALWKSYIRKGMSDQEAANHTWIDLVRYDANSGGMNFWKQVPLNFFVPWRTGTYVTLAKAFRSHPIRTLLFVGAVEYLREMRYRKTGRWTHLPTDYLDAPLAEAVQSATERPNAEAAQTILAIAATTALFGPGGGQAPSSIKDLMAALHGDPENKARLINMFWGLSQIYGIPRDFKAYLKDGNPDHLVNILTSAAVSEHSALKYEPRRMMRWLPEWMPGFQKSELVKYAEGLQKKIEARKDKATVTREVRHGVSATFERAPEDQQLEELERATGKRKGFSIKK